MSETVDAKEPGSTRMPPEEPRGNAEALNQDKAFFADHGESSKNAGMNEMILVAPPAATPESAPASAPDDPGKSVTEREERMFFYALLYMLSHVLSMLMNAVSALSVRYKIAGTLIIVLLLTVLSLGVMTFSRQKSLLEQEMKNRAEVLVQQLAQVGKEGLLTKQELPVFAMIAGFQKSSGAAYAMVADSQGKVFVHSTLNKKGELLTDPASLHSVRSDSLLFQETEYEGEPVLDAALPIVSRAKNIRIGTARVGISLAALNAAIHRQVVLFLWISLAFMAIGLVISFVLAKFLTRPIVTLVEGMQHVAQGDVSLQIQVRYRDEIGRLTEAFNEMTLSLREKLHMEKYLSEATVRSIRLHRDTAHLKLGGENKYVTALFSDVRGFTSMSESMKPEEVVGLLNIYLNLQAKVIRQWGGVVDKFVGDEVMAIFEGKDAELNAVRAAMQIQHYCRTLNEARSAAGEKEIHVGIGVNSGDVVMGNMGSEDHMDYTVIGDTINTASRLCGVARAEQVVISRTIADEIGSLSTLRMLEPVRLKGKDNPIEILEVLDVQGASRREMRHELNAAVEYQLAGLTDAVSGAIARDISSWGCLLEMNVPLGLGSRLRVTINHQSLGAMTADATVHHIRKKNGAYQIGISFVDITDTSRYRIVEWVHQVASESTSRAA